MVGWCMLKKCTRGHVSSISVKLLPRECEHLKAKLAVFVTNPKVTIIPTHVQNYQRQRSRVLEGK